MEKCPMGIMNKINLPPDKVTPTAIIVGDPKWLELLAKEASSYEYFGGYKSMRSMNLVVGGKRISAISFGYGHSNMHRVVVELGAFGVKNVILVSESQSLAPGRVSDKEICIIYASCRGEKSSSREIDIEFPAVAHPSVIRSLRNAAESLGYAARLVMSFTTDLMYPTKIDKLDPVRDQILQTNIELEDWDSSAFLVFTTARGMAAGVITCAGIAPRNLGYDGSVIEDETFAEERQKLMKIAVEAAALLS